MKHLSSILTGALLAVSSALHVQAAPIISEFMASNDAELADEDGEFSDWIEIFNPDAAEVRLDGYYLTDTAADLTGWRIPDVTLAAGGYLVVFASGKDRVDPTGELHTDFKLSANSGYLALVAPDGVTVLSEFSPTYPPQFEDQSYGVGSFGTPEVIIADGAAVRYLVPTDGSLATSWTDSPAQFDDSSWAAGTAGIGFETSTGDLFPLVATNISTEMKGNNASVFLRFPFDYSAAGKQLLSLDLTVIVDDGFVAYINGQQVASFQAPTPLEYNSTATGDVGDSEVLANPSSHRIAATPGLINDGENVLAIHGLNVRSSSSDFLIVPDLKANVIDTNGPLPAGYFDSPTPEGPNSAGQLAGPIFVAVTDKPERPTAGNDLLITAQMAGLDSPVDSVTMYYRVMQGGETSVTMADDGAAPDSLAGDSVYTAAIPGTEFSAGDMIRWRFMAVDEQGTESKMPPFRDPLDSHEYVGTVAVDPGVLTNLTVLETFLQNPGAAGNTSGTRGAIFYLGELYDNVFINRHGQSTGGFPKKSYNIDFNKSQRFRWSEDAPRVKDIDLLTNWADKSKARHVLSWEIMREAGVHAHFAYTVRVQQNGQFFSTADLVEDADEVYLDRAGLNPDGALYKVYSNTLSAGQTGNAGVEKKNRRSENNQDLTDFIADLNAGTVNDQWTFIYDNVNLPMCVNMAAANCVVRNTDMHSKNWYIYRDTGRSDEWGLLPWDLDLAHGRKWNGTDNYFDTNLFTTEVIRVGTAVKLVSQMWARPEVKAMMERRIRTLNDRFLNHPDTPYEQRYFERRLDEMLAQIDPPEIVPSDAQLDFEKWGSWIHSNNGVSVPYTTNHPDIESMAEGVQRWKDEYLPGRRSHIYARNDIPASQSGQIPFTYAALVTAGASATVSVPADASDDATWMQPAFDDAGWAQGVTGIGYDNGAKYQPLIGFDTKAEMVANNTNSVYMRIEFEVPDPSIYQALQLHMQYDDGYVAYLNGVKIHERNQPTPLAWNSAATSSEEVVVGEFDVFDISGSVGSLVAGTNVLAIHCLNISLSNSDFLIRPELHAGVPDNNGSIQPLIEFGVIEFSPASGNQDEEFIELVNNNAIAVDISDWEIGGGVEFKLAGGTVIPANSSLYLSPDIKAFRARTTSPKGGEQRFVVGGYKGHLSSFGETLTLNDAAGDLNNSTTYVGDPSDAQEFLVITEIMYHPEPDGAAEYIELMNISDSVTLDLTGITFTQGVTFDFTGSDVTSLAPGARVLVVRDLAAFEAAHGNGLPVAGTFLLDSSLSNGGESLKLEDAEGSTIKEFSYNDKAPWPVAADTGGFSLVLIAARTNPDPSEPGNWRASAAIGGTPGGDDAVTFSGDPTADGDGDGLSAFIEHALGSSDGDANAGAGATWSGVVETGGAAYASFSYRSNPAAEDVVLTVETTTDLATWVDASAQLVALETTPNADGTVTTSVRFAAPIAVGQKHYFRLRAEMR